MGTKVVVIGVGYMGGLHALEYHSMEDVDLVAVVDTNMARAKQVAEQLGCVAFQTVGELLDGNVSFEAASVATPTAFHKDITLNLLGRGIHCLVEKPMAANSREAFELVEAAKSASCVLLPGHVERFNPGIAAVKAERPEIKYIKSYRVGPMSFRSIDTDVIIDVLIHDLDLALYLVGPRGVEVEVCRAIGSPEGINDIVNAHLRLGSDCFADLTASRLAVARRRKLRMFTDDGYYSVDCEKMSAMKLSRDRYYAGLARLKRYQDLGGKPTPEQIFSAVGAESIAERGRSQESDALGAELRYFIERTGGGTPSEVVVEAEDGVLAIELAEAVLRELNRFSYMQPGMSFRR